MSNYLILLIGVLFIFMGIIFNGFKDQTYNRKFAQRKATEVKRLLCCIRKMENAITVKTVLALYPDFHSSYSDLQQLKLLNKAAFAQVTSLAHLKYQNIYQVQLTPIQREALEAKANEQDIYSKCLIEALKGYSNKIEEKMAKFKSDTPKERRKNEIIETVAICVTELNQRGNPEFITMIPNIISRFNIKVNVVKQSELEANGEEIPIKDVRIVNNKLNS